MTVGSQLGYFHYGNVAASRGEGYVADLAEMMGPRLSSRGRRRGEKLVRGEG